MSTPAVTDSAVTAIGAWGSKGRGLAHPVAVAVDDRRHRLAVANRSTSWPSPHGRSVRITVVDEDENVVAEFGHLGDEPHQLAMPSALCIDSDGAFYVTDEQTNRVAIFEPDGTYRRSFGRPGAGDGELDRPSGLGIDAEGRFLVVDSANHRVQRFDANGVFDRVLVGPGSFPQLQLPWGLAVDGDRWWLCDWGADRLHCIDADGVLMRTIGDGVLRRPAGVAVHGHLLFVTDWGHDRVVVMTTDGAVVDVWHGHATLSSWARERIEAFDRMAADRDASGRRGLERLFRRPTGIAVSADGTLYVADTGRHRVQIFTAPALSST